jgi:mRNA interferase RelE/StbE
MRIIFERSFLIDIQRIKDKGRLRKLANLIDVLRNSASLNEIQNLKKLKGHPSAFRIKMGDFRVGFFLENDTLILVRFLNRKDIYRGFPR